MRLLREPIQAELISNGLPCLVLGFTDTVEVLVVAEDGRLDVVDRSAVQTNWRYDWNGHEWLEVDGTTDGAEEDPAPDGGAEVQGRVPDLDDDGPGDPVDTEGRATAGGPGDLDTGEA